MQQHASLTLPRRSILTRLRFALAGALLLVPFIPLAVRVYLLPETAMANTITVSMWANITAVFLEAWTRLSIRTYPGTRSSATILPSVSAAHATVLAALLLLRLPYDRLAVTMGYAIHVGWSFLLYFVNQRRLRQRIAVLPFGEVDLLTGIDSIDWHVMRSPSLAEADGCDAMVADFAALPDEWEALLADAAVEGRLVYQVKQLHESLTGRVQVDKLSENSFGSLIPTRSYSVAKGIGDWIFAVALLPVVLPLMALVAIAIRLDSPGPAIFRQQRVGQGGKPIRIYKFRTMSVVEEASAERGIAMTAADDPRITRVGHFLRKSRIDELPQILNILRGEMSWIGPRPEAAVLSAWYAGDVPFYRYRHVVKPGISGWAQVKQGHVAEVDEIYEKLQYDFFYIKYFSPWLDVLILFKTLRTVVSGFGAK
ncbi:sugar transferase [Sphingomonas sp. ASV193]|uniref:sugar transferase n=1 Tax=Sphingomonas sp. ASV193 TaxID=3144405 RepID=UPI0032E8E43F